ncbi:hypothetical protein Tco_0216093 [Tanacetum coccineum]
MMTTAIQAVLPNDRYRCHSIARKVVVSPINSEIMDRDIEEVDVPLIHISAQIYHEELVPPCLKSGENTKRKGKRISTSILVQVTKFARHLSLILIIPVLIVLHIRLRKTGWSYMIASTIISFSLRTVSVTSLIVDPCGCKSIDSVAISSKTLIVTMWTTTNNTSFFHSFNVSWLRGLVLKKHSLNDISKSGNLR